MYPRVDGHLIYGQKHKLDVFYSLLLHDFNPKQGLTRTI